MTFKELNLNENLLEALEHMGFENATPIQEQAIPQILNNKDLIACAQTGTGKTAAFILPILHKLTGKPDTYNERTGYSNRSGNSRTFLLCFSRIKSYLRRWWR
jgi:superfamily II DNA/RNA helicase